MLPVSATHGTVPENGTGKSPRLFVWLCPRTGHKTQIRESKPIVGKPKRFRCMYVR